jgi:enoyl reductase-like protein
MGYFLTASLRRVLTARVTASSACSNGGYHCEFAGGGLPLPNYTYTKFAELQEAQDPGVGITLNTLYANPYLWGFQYPIVCELRKKGTPYAHSRKQSTPSLLGRPFLG